MTKATKTLLASVGILILTVIHHSYGAVIYSTPWRHHIAFIVLPVLVVLIILYSVFRLRPLTLTGKVSMWFFVLLIVLVPIAWIGIFEGGYNHVLKNILFFGGLPQSALSLFFPAPMYEMPNDFWFEFTGVLQFFITLLTIYFLIGMLRENRAERSAA